MRDASYILGAIGLLSLIAGFGAWGRVLGQLETEPTLGRVGVDSRRVRFAAGLVMIAFAFSAVGAVVAIINWYP